VTLVLGGWVALVMVTLVMGCWVVMGAWVTMVMVTRVPKPWWLVGLVTREPGGEPGDGDLVTQ